MTDQASTRRASILTPIPRDDLKQMLLGAAVAVATAPFLALVVAVLSLAG